jgi:hypothetical protein
VLAFGHRLYGVVGDSVIYVEVHGELDLVSCNVDNVYLLLQAPSAWVEFAFVFPTPGCLFTSQFVRRWVTFVPCAETIILVLGPCWGVWGG